MDLKYKYPKDALNELKEQFNVKSILELKEKVKGAGFQEESELLYGSLFAECLNRINDQKYQFAVRIAEREPADCELVNYTLYKKNQDFPEDEPEPDHFLLQNVSITEHPIHDALKTGKTNFYEIIADHLYRTKLSPASGDYAGTILVFFLHINVKNLGISELRKAIRELKQNKFEQIWVNTQNGDDYYTFELLKKEGNAAIANLSDLN